MSNSIKLFQGIEVGGLALRNRVAMPPMCMFIAGNDGKVTDFHVQHYASRAWGGVGLIVLEATAVTPQGRISDADLGIWSDEQIEGLKRIVDAVHAGGAKISIQLGHAGRKAMTASRPVIGPTDEAFSETMVKPNAMTEQDIADVILAFREGARRAVEAGFDMIELHAAHGYLLSSFLSPVSNTRTDEYGQHPELIIEKVASSVREVIGGRPLCIRVSAKAYHEKDEAIEVMAQRLAKIRPEVIHVSSGGVWNTGVSGYPGYQIGFARVFKQELPNTVVLGGGLIDSAWMANEAIEGGACDMVYIGRALLRNPHWVLDQAKQCGVKDFIPKPYERAWT